MGDADSSGIDVRILGDVRAAVGEREIDLGAPGPRSVFAVLATRINTTVTLDELVASVWGEEAPKSAPDIVRNYVSILRKALEPGRSPHDKPRVLISTRAGYLLQLPPRAVDANRFEDAAAEARRRWSADDFPAALTQCEFALGEWGGQPLGGTVGPYVEAERSRLQLVERGVQEIRCATLIEVGSAGDAVAMLSKLVADNPLHERLHELLMLAFYRAGRQAEALQVYQRIRRQLVEDLGIEPGPALRRMHERVLAGDCVEAPPTAVRSTPGGKVVPAQVPHGAANFVGREDELRQLSRMCAEASASEDDLGGSVVISAIAGVAGVGKTAFAIELANRTAALFPDGQLFLDLRGFDPRHQPVTVENALRHLLHGLGVVPEMLTADAETLAAMYRSLLAGRRVMVVLDNAADAEHVRPLLPGSKGCVALVTSRNRLAGLVARDGARRVTIDVLAPAESVELLRRTLGAEQVDGDIAAARELAARCGHLPLALRIAAERIVDSEHVQLADIVGELRVEGDRLDTLSTLDDESSTLRAVFSWSYRVLAPEDARSFRLLGLHPGVQIGLGEAAALLATDVPLARRRLDGLVRWHLLEPAAPGRYQFHDLLRIYAAECAESDTGRTVAVARMVNWYLGSVLAAREILAPGFGEIEVAPPDPGRPPMAFHAYDEAITWAGRELSTLGDVVQLAVEHGLDAIAVNLAAALGALYYCTSRWTEWLRVVDLGQATAERVGDRLSQGRLHNDAGVACHFLGEHDRAIASHQAATGILTALGDQRDQGIAVNLAVAYAMMGRHLDAVPLLEDALELARSQGNRHVEATVAINLGAVLSTLGRHAEAIEYGRRGVDLTRQVGPRHLLGHCLTQVGESCLRASRLDEAIQHFRDALDVWRELGNKWGEVSISRTLAEALHQAGRTEDVRRLVVDALEIMRETGYLVANDREATDLRALLAEVN